MLNIISPRIHNLGDFANCLPVLSGLYKKTGEKINFGICDRIQQFKGIRELLSSQEMFHKVSFMRDFKTNDPCLVIDDNYPEMIVPNIPISTCRYANYIAENYKIDFVPDGDFVLKIPQMPVEYIPEKILIGDRWSAKQAVELDTRRYSNMIETSGIMKDADVYYLDYTHDLVYNCNLIKKSERPFVTTFTGIGIIADLMKKDTYILWGEDVRNWDNNPIQYSFDLHYYKDRNSKLVYVNDFDVNSI